MRLFQSLLILCFLLFQSCEVLEDKPEAHEDNKSAEVKPEKPIEITKVTPPEKEDKEPEPQKPVVIQQKPTPDKKPKTPKPEKQVYSGITCCSKKLECNSKVRFPPSCRNHSKRHKI